MQRKHMLKVVAAIGLIVIGILFVVIGLLGSIFALDAGWLWMSLLGIVCILLSVGLIVRQLHKSAQGFVAQRPAGNNARPVKHIKHED